MTHLDFMELMQSRRVTRPSKYSSQNANTNQNADNEGTRMFAGRFTMTAQTALNMAGGIKLRPQISSLHQTAAPPSLWQTPTIHPKSFRHLRNLALSQFPPADLQFLQREFQLDNARALYGV